MADTLVIFDFDCTIAEVDSDPWVAQQLGATHLMENLRSQLPWNDMMDALMEALHAHGNSIQEVEEALRRIPLQPEKITAIKLAHALGCELRIVSDANSFFIKTILDEYNVTHLFKEIHTNPASIDVTGRLHIKPFHPKCEAPHGCPLCPPNMCKGKIISEIQSGMEQLRRRIIYVGDGCGDFCPTLRLKEGDCVLPREEYPLLAMLMQNITDVKASVHPWGTAKIMEEKLVALIEAPKKLEEEHGFGSGCDENCAKCAMSPLEQVKEIVARKSVYV
ncbi:hypothetical protein GOP47_0004578 [Adiantum capillus-veneris]|uniref:Uncharacterized protein n=1 Tax=Adiantum capillus-veneris TaxID=13818 RepID=A0A9D4V8I0_ADICA|nr:hypothetical protein GOP47_0004020 [Adiantum capillus-veneris]KAI5081395.1 hypothetical protein GOP47_0004578 [Adiantum capillus-veneris]